MLLRDIEEKKLNDYLNSLDAADLEDDDLDGYEPDFEWEENNYPWLSGEGEERFNR